MEHWISSTPQTDQCPEHLKLTQCLKPLLALFLALSTSCVGRLVLVRMVQHKKPLWEDINYATEGIINQTCPKHLYDRTMKKKD